MPMTTADKRTIFRKMHESGCFVLPNPWDVGSARALQHLGFKAIASTSAGFAWSIGKADNRVTLEEVLQHLTMVIDRLTAYADAGADCLYAPGIKTKEQISAVVKAVHPRPVNLLIGAPGLSVAEAAELGVRRISVGGSLARAAWGGLMRASREIAEKGTFTELGNGYPGGELNKMLS